MGNKQTAVEWFIEQLQQKGDAWVNVSIGRMQISIKEEEYIDLINQAKAMKKQQIIDAYKEGYYNGVLYGGYPDNEDAENYYSNTFLYP